VAAEHRLDFVLREELLHRGDDLGDQLVPVLLAPGRPALLIGFEVHDDHHPVFDELPQEAGLGANVLNVVMPVIARLQRFAYGLIYAVPVRQSVEDEQDPLPRREGRLPRGVNMDFDFGVEGE
jgi:hypothetical protein